ncbi:MAG: fumarylacetoacetate hydrolase family protein, partial [Vampirovibrionia bacterium]
MNKAIISFSEHNSPDVNYGVLDLKTSLITPITSPFNAQISSGETKSLDTVKLLPPTIPTKIIAVGLNYRDHAEEFNFEIPKEPLIFSKPPSAVIAMNEIIQLPKISK